MIRNGKTLLCLLGTVVASGVAQALPLANNPYYESIVNRNTFGLNPIPVVPPQTNIPVAEPPPNISFTGISSQANTKRAWFIVKPTTSNAKPEYVNLAEGEKSGALEVVSITAESGEVKVLNAGRELVLNFKDNGNKDVSKGPAPAGPSPVPPPLGIPAPAQPGLAAQVGNRSGNGTANQPQQNGVMSALPFNGGNQPQPMSGPPGIPMRSLRTLPPPSGDAGANNFQAQSFNGQQPGLPQQVQPSQTTLNMDAQQIKAAQILNMHIQQNEASKRGQTLPPIPPL